MHLYRVARNNTVEGTMTVCGVFQFDVGQAVCFVTFVTTVFTITGINGKSRAFMLRIGMGMDITQIHLACRGGQSK